jgi:CHAT domain
MTTESARSAPGLPDPVRKAIARDDLLRLARDAEVAVGIVLGQKGAMTQDFDDESALFSEALRLQNKTAEDTNSPAIQLRALTAAGIIVRFCELVDIKVTPRGGDEPVGQFGAGQFHDQALRQLQDAREIRGGEELDRDPYHGITIKQSAIRDLRLNGKYQSVRDLADLPDMEFAGTGADQRRAEYQFELGAALLLDGQAAQVRPALIESEQGYWAGQAGAFPSRHRFDYTLGLAAWAQDDLAEASSRLSRARRHLRDKGHGKERWDIEDLLVTLAQADLLAAGDDRSAATVNAAISYIGEALDITERVRDRWKVISRSRSPLSVAFRRVYGDIALAASEFIDPRIARLGLRAALSAKQTGFALRMRTGRAALVEGSRVRQLVNLVVRAETKTAVSALADTTDATLAGYRRSLQREVSPMLADTVFPASSDPARVIGLVGDRHALDYVNLPDTATGWTSQTHWFRTLIEPGGAVTFERIVIGVELAAFIERVKQPDVELGSALSGLDWRALAVDLIPPALRGQLIEAAGAAPAKLIISAHSELSLMPWAALKLDQTTLLVEGAVVAQIPVLTCLAESRPPSVAGPALVELASSDPNHKLADIDVRFEREAWKLDLERDGQVLLSECAVGPEPAPVPVPGTLATALAKQAGRWHLLHIASHGEGSGLDQTLYLRGEPLSVGRALTLRWPEAVLMASCQVGRLVNVADGEPLNLVMALLAGGSHCVVAGIDPVRSYPTGRIAARMVKLCQEREIGLDAALREAQLDSLNKRERPWELWAVLSAYSR